jgi:hypothetical protein
LPERIGLAQHCIAQILSVEALAVPRRNIASIPLSKSYERIGCTRHKANASFQNTQSKNFARLNLLYWHHSCMPKSSPKTSERRKNPAAVALGRRGGLKGGKARMEKLSATERSALAQRANEVRWSKKK